MGDYTTDSDRPVGTGKTTRGKGYTPPSKAAADTMGLGESLGEIAARERKKKAWLKEHPGQTYPGESAVVAGPPAAGAKTSPSPSPSPGTGEGQAAALRKKDTSQ